MFGPRKNGGSQQNITLNLGDPVGALVLGGANDWGVGGKTDLGTTMV